MHNIENKNNIFLKGHHKKDNNVHTEEFLCVDFNFFRKEPYLHEELSVNNLPIISVEHENKPARIKYNFNKLVNLQTQIKVLICYVNNNINNNELILDKKKLIREFAKFRSSKSSDKSKFLIIIGNTEMSDSEEFDGFVIYPSGSWKEIK